MNTKIIIVISLFTFLTTSSLFAQDTSKGGPVLSYQVNLIDYSDCNCDDTPVLKSVIELDVTYKHQVAQRLYVTHKAAYTHQDIGLRGYFETDNDDVVLHSYFYSYLLNAEYEIANGWMATGYVKPELRSNLEINEKSFYVDFEGAALMSYQTTSGWTLGAGIAYSRTLAKGLVHPLALIGYNNRKNFRANIYIPEVAEAWVKVFDNVDLGMIATLEGEEFKGEGSAFDSMRSTIQYADFMVGPAIQVDVTRRFSFNIRASYTTSRHFVIETKNTSDSVNPSLGWSISAGLTLAL